MPFASGFSEKLNIAATATRPPYSPYLSFEQAAILCELSNLYIYEDKRGYYIRPHDHDNRNGIDESVYVSWMVRTDGNNLIYYPTLESRYMRGDFEQVGKMLQSLANNLPFIGFADELIVPLNEPVITLPKDLERSNHGITVMFLSEFQARYRELYRFFKEKIF